VPVQQVAVREIGLDRELGGSSAVQFSRPAGRESAAGRRHSAAVRRRQIVLGLGVLAAIALLAAIESEAPAAWWVALCIIGLGCAYLALVRRLGRVRIEREFAAMFDSSSVDLSRWSDVRLATSPSDRAQGPTTTSEPMRIMREVWALARFGLANLAGWLLAPVVFALTLVLGETPQDSTGQRWLANLKAAQARLADQSLRTLAISAATTASVTAVGTVAAMAGTPTTASAASTPASIGILAGPGLVNGPTSTYRVVAGDTLSAIAARFGTTVANLAAINHLSNPNLIFAGQVLTISGSAGGGGPGNAGRAGNGGSTATTSAPAASGTTYRVVAGDTLSAIAARFGTTVANLAAINHLANPNLIFAGEVLTISGTSGQAAAPAPTSELTPAPRPAPTSAPLSAAATAVRAALAQVGKPYVFGGAGPNSFDCSGLVMYAWEQAGVALPHYSVAQYEDTERISASQLEPGDLLFYDNDDGAQPGHVTIYIGGGQVVTADQPGTAVRVEAVDWDGIPMGYGRVR
jgi:cell wall-associated NlpC family hydrolase